MSNANVSMPGFKEVAKLMATLPDAVNRKILLSAEREALGPANRTLKQLTAQRTGVVTGRLRASIGIKALRAKDPWTVTSLAGARYGGRLGAPHFHLVEKGTQERELKQTRLLSFKTKGGQVITATIKKTGKVQGRHMVADTIERHSSQVMNDMETTVLRSIERSMSRLNKNFS
jgi:hypothetical protein